MLLPFLKESRRSRIAKPMDEKSYGGSASDQLEDHCIQELMEACASKDVARFRSSLEALVMNLFEDEEANA